MHTLHLIEHLPQVFGVIPLAASGYLPLGLGYLQRCFVQNFLYLLQPDIFQDAIIDTNSGIGHLLLQLIDLEQFVGEPPQVIERPLRSLMAFLSANPQA
jgi:hypothetical protein